MRSPLQERKGHWAGCGISHFERGELWMYTLLFLSYQNGLVSCGLDP